MRAGIKLVVHYKKKTCRISISKEGNVYKNASSKPGVQFAPIQWGCINSKEEPIENC